ncbi:hypothetical protein ACHAXR_003619 [Thalassiosira sp. AJA248-18]
MTTYDICVASSGGDDTATLQCVVSAMEESVSDVTSAVTAVFNDLDSLKVGVEIFFLIFAASIMFFMQAGFTMLCAGSVQAKNLQNTIMKNVLDACGKYFKVQVIVCWGGAGSHAFQTLTHNISFDAGSGIAFFAVGYAFAYGGTPHDTMDVYTHDPVETPITFIGTQNFFLTGVENYAFWMYQYAFAATAATIVAGTLAERCQMTAYLLYSTFLTAFVYPVIAHAVWSTEGF